MICQRGFEARPEQLFFYHAGHGGPNAADFVRSNLFDSLLNNQKFTTDRQQAVGEARIMCGFSTTQKNIIVINKCTGAGCWVHYLVCSCYHPCVHGVSTISLVSVTQQLKSARVVLLAKCGVS